MTLELALPETELFVPENKIGQGAVREAYICGDFVLKVVKPDITIRKKTLFSRKSIPTEEFIRNRYGIADFNRYEFEQYQKIMRRVPANLLNSFSRIIGVKNIAGRSTSISELVTDAGGRISRTLAGNGPVHEAGFWERMDELERFFLENKIPYIGMESGNVLVKKPEDGSAVPVIVDYKRIGQLVMPRTISMLFSYGVPRKLKKKFRTVREQYKI